MTHDVRRKLSEQSTLEDQKEKAPECRGTRSTSSSGFSGGMGPLVVAGNNIRISIITISLSQTKGPVAGRAHEEE